MNSDSAFNIAVGLVIVALIVVGGILIKTGLDNSNERKVQKIEVCRTIEDPALRTLCVNGTYG